MLLVCCWHVTEYLKGELVDSKSFHMCFLCHTKNEDACDFSVSRQAQFPWQPIAKLTFKRFSNKINKVLCSN